MGPERAQADPNVDCAYWPMKTKKGQYTLIKQSNIQSSQGP